LPLAELSARIDIACPIPRNNPRANCEFINRERSVLMENSIAYQLARSAPVSGAVSQMHSPLPMLSLRRLNHVQTGALAKPDIRFSETTRPTGMSVSSREPDVAF
jgi:hypothetical protein